MSFGLAFWILMGIWLIFGFATIWPRGETKLNVPVAGGSLLLFVLLLLLGWAVFKAPLHP